MPFAQEKIGFEHPPRLFLRTDTQNAANPLGKTAYYDIAAKSVTLYITGRHPKDIMRSLAHELVHHKQNCEGRFDNIGEMGEGSAQINPRVRKMEVEANRDGSMCLRDWEDGIKGTIYFEHLQKGVNNTMSIKTWKNKELTTLLSEAWGFGFDLNNLNEVHKEGHKGKGLPPWLKKKEGDKKGDDDGDEGEEEEEEVTKEAFEHPKSATGSGPTNKAGKLQRDVANKDTGKFGQGGSKGGGKKSAGGTNAPPMAGRLDRDVANKVPSDGRWLKENEEEEETLDEMCPPEGHDMGMDAEEPEFGEGDIEGLAARALEAIHALASAAGADISTTVETGEEEEEPMEERLRRGRKGRHIRGKPDPALRPEGVENDKIEEQVRRLVRKTIRKMYKENKK